MPIGKDKALSIAAAAFSRDLADEIRYSEVDAELDESPAQYEVEITGQKGEEIEYKIDAYTGTILESKRETEEKTSAAQPTSSGDIGHAKAKAIALNHAGVSESKAYDMEIELDEEDGMLVYEVEFKSGRHGVQLRNQCRHRRDCQAGGRAGSLSPPRWAVRWPARPGQSVKL